MIRKLLLNTITIFVSVLTLVFYYIKFYIEMLIDWMKKILRYFPLVFGVFIGCSSSYEPGCDDACNPVMYTELPKVNNIYQLEYDQNYTQTFAPIYLNVGTSGVKKIAFASDIVVQVQGQWFDLVNKTSYTRDDGTTQTTLGVFEQNIGEIINIYYGFYNECDDHYMDQIQVKVVDNE